MSETGSHSAFSLSAILSPPSFPSSHPQLCSWVEQLTNMQFFAFDNLSLFRTTMFIKGVLLWAILCSV
ncbi:hypothetical protein PHLCEN_2v12936, partial [Hermanssonia centrifuga]